MPILTSEQRARFEREGYLALPSFKSQAEVALARERAQALAEQLRPPALDAVFSTSDPSKLADAALLASAETVQAFYEEDALDRNGALTVPAAQAINKIGHALHDADPVFAPFCRDPRLGALCTELGLPRARLMQSMLIYKQPHIGGVVRWHQDATYLFTEPSRLLGLWIALEDATLDNGCLWVQPGGHRGPLRERFVRDAQGPMQLHRLDDTPWPGPGQGQPLPVPAGSLIVFDGKLPHYSAPNLSPQRRLAFTLHVVDESAHYASSNWLQRSANNPAPRFDSPPAGAVHA
jgi:phytanoyl-CoA hydroxylase